MLLGFRTKINYLFFMLKPLSDFNVIEISRAETTSALTPVSSRLPMILLQKPSNIPYFLAFRNIYFGLVLVNVV